MRKGEALASTPIPPLPARGKAQWCWKRTISQLTASETFSPLFCLGCCFKRYFFPIISNYYLGLFPFEFAEVYQFTSFPKGILLQAGMWS